MNAKKEVQVTCAWVGPKGTTFPAGGTIGLGSVDLGEAEAAKILHDVAARHGRSSDRMSADALFETAEGLPAVEDLIAGIEGRYLASWADKRLLLARATVEYLYKPIHLDDDVERFVASLFFQKMVGSHLDLVTLAEQCQSLILRSSSQAAPAIFDTLLGRDGPLRAVRRFIDANRKTVMVDGVERIAVEAARFRALCGVTGEPMRNFILWTNPLHLSEWIFRHGLIEVIGEATLGMRQFYCEYEEFRRDPDITLQPLRPSYQQSAALGPIRLVPLAASHSLRLASIVAGAAASVAAHRGNRSFSSLAKHVKRHNLGETIAEAYASVDGNCPDAVPILGVLTRLAEDAERLADERLPAVKRPVG